MSRQTDLGTVQVRNEVIGTIASLAAQEVEGVVGVWRGLIPLPVLLLRDGGVKVDTRGEEVRLWLSLVVDYGVSLQVVAAQVQERVREMIEKMTNLTAVEVHVSIHHVQKKRS